MFLNNISKRFTSSLFRNSTGFLKYDTSTKFYPACFSSATGTPFQEVIPDTLIEDSLACKNTIVKVNNQIINKEQGRLFAVVHLCGKQYRVVEEDILMLEGYWAPKIRDVINLKKVLLVGGADFTLIGRPLLPTGLVNIKATVVEKDLTYTKVHYLFLKRERVRKINFIKNDLTALRINKIEVYPRVNEMEESVLVERTI